MTGTDTAGRRAARTAVRALVALSSVAALTATGLAWSVQQRIESGAVTSDAVGDATATAPGEAFTALLVGLDARTDASGNPLPPALLDALHAGPDEGQLHTDTIMLLHVPAGPAQQAVAISVPRDSFVRIDGDRGTHKINSAYRRGLQDAEKALTAQGVTGAELDRRSREAGRSVLVETVEDLTAIEIDHFAEINLAGFVELTESLGGVPVCLNAAVRDSYSGIDLPAGLHSVSGAEALAFVRQRHGLEDGDLDRIARQQAFIGGLGRRLAEGGALADPARLGRVVNRHVVLDRGWNLTEALTQLGRLAGGEIAFRTIPVGRTDLATPVDGIAVQIDQDAVRAFTRAIRAGVLPPATPRAGTASTTSSAPTTSAAPTTGAAPTAVTAAPSPLRAAPAVSSALTDATAAPGGTAAQTARPRPTAPSTIAPSTIDGITCVD